MAPSLPHCLRHKSLDETLLDERAGGAVGCPLTCRDYRGSHSALQSLPKRYSPDKT